MNVILITWNNANRVVNNHITLVTQCRLDDSGQCVLTRLGLEVRGNVVGVMVNEDGSETAIGDLVTDEILVLNHHNTVIRRVPADSIGVSLSNYCPMEVYQAGPEIILTESTIYNACATDYVWNREIEQYSSASDLAIRNLFNSSLDNSYDIVISHSEDTGTGMIYYGTYSTSNPYQTNVVVEEVDYP